MAKKRTKEQNAAIYRRRQERSKELYGAGYGAKAGARRRRRLNNLAPGDTTARPKPLEVEAGGRRITKTAGTAAQRHLMEALRRAAANGERVKVNATFQNSRGDLRTRTIDRLP